MDPKSPEEIPERLQLPLVWVAPEEQPVLTGNQFLVQFEKDLFFVSVGQLTPPAILGTPEERYAQAKGLSFVPVKTVARFSLTRRNVEELIGVLKEMATNFDQATQREE